MYCKLLFSKFLNSVFNDVKLSHFNKSVILNFYFISFTLLNFNFYQIICVAVVEIVVFYKMYLLINSIFIMLPY